MKYNFIKKNDAMIVWNHLLENNVIFMEELCVYEYTKEERKEYSRTRISHKVDIYNKYRYSTGNCDDYWKKMSDIDTVFKLFKIILDYKTKDWKQLRKCLIEFGKIEEMEGFRKMDYRMYENHEIDYSYEDFLEIYYT